MKLRKENKYNGYLNKKILNNVLSISTAVVMLLSGCGNSENIDKKILGFSYTLNESIGSYQLTSVVDVSNLQYVDIYLVDNSGLIEILFLKQNIYKDKDKNIHVQMLNIETSELFVEETITISDKINEYKSSGENEHIKKTSLDMLIKKYGYTILDCKNITYYIKELSYPKSFYTSDEITELIHQIRNNYEINNSLNVAGKVLNKTRYNNNT